MISSVRRIGAVITIEPAQVEEYKALHAAVWPSVLLAIARANITNYSIFLHEPELLLFSYFEYTGNDLVADLAEMARDVETQRWWQLTEPCQRPLATRAEGEWWAAMTPVFHFAGSQA